MLDINRDAARWTTVLDFYDAILKEIGAPDWHGQSIDGLVDSMIWGSINAVDPPYVVRIHNLQAAPDDVREYVRSAQSYIVQGREEFSQQEEHDVEVSIDIVS